MARKHPGFYRVRARKHEAAARNSKGYKKEGHEEVAAGYHKLAAHSEYGGRSVRRGRKGRKGRKGHRRGRR